MARTYGKLALSPLGADWVIEEIEPHVAIRFKQLFPSIRKSAEPPYRLRNTITTAADLDWFMTRYPLATSEQDLEALTSGRLMFDDNQAEMERILQPGSELPGFKGLQLGQEVRHYQAQAVEVLARSGGLLLADEVGLGKTYTTCGACLLDGALPAFIVCQAHLQKQWHSVIESFTTLSAHSIRGTKPYDLPRAHVYIFRYSQLIGWSDLFGKILRPGLLAFDEVQELRTGTKSGKGEAAKLLSKKATMRLGLTATPIYNYGLEIWEVMRFIRPEVLGKTDDFMREWTSAGKIKNPTALGTYLREQYAFLRRTKKDVGQEMPPVNRIVDFVDHDEGSMRSIEDLAAHLAHRATTGTFTERGQASRELDLIVRHQTGVSKAKQVAQFCRILVEGGEPIVLVGWHRDVYDIWLKELGDLNPVLYTGSESAAGKNRSKEAFCSGQSKLMIMSLRSGAGLDGLQYHCSMMVFGELDWSPGVHHQCIGRLDREGQTQPVTAIFLVTDEGSDPPMMEVLGIKASEASQIVDPGLGVQQVHSDISPVQMLVQRYLSRRKSMEPPSLAETAILDAARAAAEGGA